MPLLVGDNPLAVFLNGMARVPFRWGTSDCMLWLADYAIARGHEDPATKLRGSYFTMKQAARIARESGGLERLIDRHLPSGCERAPTERGGVAVVNIGGAGGELFGNLAGGIILHSDRRKRIGTIALYSQEGLLFAQFSDVPVVASWRVPECRR